MTLDALVLFASVFAVMFPLAILFVVISGLAKEWWHQ